MILVIFLMGWRTGTFAALEIAQPFRLGELSVLGEEGKMRGMSLLTQGEEINLTRRKLRNNKTSNRNTTCGPQFCLVNFN